MLKVKEKIIEVIDNIRPYLNMDGGDIEFVEYKDNYVYIKLSGACQNCIMQGETVNNGIEEMIKQEVPEVKGVIVLDL